MNTQQALERYCTFFEALTPADIAHFDQIYDSHARFKDPFHDVNQLAQVQAIFTHMFQVAPDARFIIQHRFTNEHSAMIIWTMMFSLRGQAMSIKGSSHLVFSDTGLVVLHRDYWDTGEELFSKLPYLGAPMRWLMKQFSALKP